MTDLITNLFLGMLGECRAANTVVQIWVVGCTTPWLGRIHGLRPDIIELALDSANGAVVSIAMDDVMRVGVAPPAHPRSVSDQA